MNTYGMSTYSKEMKAASMTRKSAYGKAVVAGILVGSFKQRMAADKHGPYSSEKELVASTLANIGAATVSSIGVTYAARRRGNAAYDYIYNNKK